MIPLLFCYFCAVAAELEMVQVLFRHGDRAPSFIYPSDVDFQDNNFPRGLSQLTHQGYEQAQELGEYLRYRYMMSQATPLFKEYNRNDVLVRSSDKDRCIETATGLVSTMFKNQIVPVHTYSNYWTDLLLKPNSVNCLKSDRIVSKDKKRLENRLNLEYSDLFEFLSDKTGWKVDAATIENVYNTIFRKYANGIPQPPWVFSQYGNRNRTILDTVIELKRQSRMESFNSFEKSRLRTGYLLGQLAKNMDERKRKMFLYATHDATITSLMYSLEISSDELPPYTAALLVELHKEDNERVVKVLYRNGTDPVEMEIPFCPSPCRLKTFQRRILPRIIENMEEFEEICEEKEEKFNFIDFLVPSLVICQITTLIYYYMDTVSKEFLH